uniref:Vascular endothelial growth factor receptor 3 n=1 Tax=Phallusia mammillata TaxID=59560 RepID=A0A6F9DDJ2_9ASCI|nr:vascular endothelial growth factor receptor 3 [Phallusia mammillata]
MDTLRVSIVFLTIVFASALGQDHPCASTKADVTVRNVTEHVSFKLPNASDLSSHQITVTYSWDVSVKGDHHFDGFLYKFYDTDQHSYANVGKRSLSLNPIFRFLSDNPLSPLELPSTSGFSSFSSDISSTDINVRLAECKNYFNESVWTVAKNGSYVQCKFPCLDHFGLPCVTGTGLCNMLKDGHQWLKRDARELTFDIAFGRHYTFEIAAYVGHKTTPALYTTKNFYIFCGEHLINEKGVNDLLAYQFCDQAQNISEMHTASSPVADLEVFAFMPDYVNHKTAAIVRWKAPHDVVKGATIEEYEIGPPAGIEIENGGYALKAKTPEEAAINPWYNITLLNLNFNQTYTMGVMPYVPRGNDVCIFPGDCSEYGMRATINIAVSDVDACVNLVWSDERSYCDHQASCVDLPPESELPANCSCGTGYHGNGIAEIWPGGTGCYDTDACLDYNKTMTICHQDAFCVDRKAPETGFTCRCQDGFFGDGFKGDFGCASKSLVIGVAVGIPISLLFIIGAFLLLRRCRVSRRRSLDLKLSKFVPMRTNPYTAPLVMRNDHVANREEQRQLPKNGAVFGAKWELQRKDIVQEDIIGRGNFGVVHKATLTKDGTQKNVAVKSLTGAYATCYRDDFLAEMALLISLGHHDNVLGMIGACTSQMGADEENMSPLLVTEYMTYGDLLHFLWDAREPAKREADAAYDFTENSLYNIGHQVASGLQFLSSSKIIHGDVAARNILVDENLQCKISDFGLANDVYRYGMIKGATERRVPFKWVSPERMMGGKVPITWRSDVWSFGILLYEMVTLGAAPYPSMDPRMIFNSLKSGYRMPRPESCNEYLYEIMMDCWKWSAIQRPSFTDLKTKLAKPLSQHTDPEDLTLKRSIHASDDLDIQQYEADIGRRDNQTTKPPNGCLENGSVTTNGGIAHSGQNGDVVHTSETSIGNGSLANGGVEFFAGNIIVQSEPDARSNGFVPGTEPV